MPVAMLYENGIVMIVINAGMPSERSVNSICAAALIIIKPTMIRAGADAAEGTSKKRGLKKSAIKKMRAVVTDVRPVRPPSATPAVLSTKLVIVDVPSAAPTTVPIASESSASFTFLMSPFLSFKLLCSAMPMSVPIVSKISTKRKVKNTVKNFSESTVEKSN